MNFLQIDGQMWDFLLVVVVAIVIIIIGLIIYYFILGSKKPKVEKPANPVNFENIPVDNDEIETMEVLEEKPALAEQVIEETAVQAETPLTKAEDEKTSTNIAVLLEQMQQDVGHEEKKVEEYEAEQEENAIISYQELLKLKAEKETKTKEVSLITEEKPVEEIKEIIENTKDEKMVEDTDEVKKFKRSEFISPIFGFNDGVVTYREIKRPVKKEEVKKGEWESDKILNKLADDAAEVIEVEEKKEIKETEENIRHENFLEALVDFRKKLD